MTNDEALAWFKELAAWKLAKAREEVVVSRGDIYDDIWSDSEPSTHTRTVETRWYEPQAATAWMLELEQALALCFPVGFELRVRWTALTKHAEGQPHVLCSQTTIDAARGMAAAAVRLLESGRLRTIWDGVRAETVAEVLDQAERLLDKKAPIASPTVLAGGALETHLRNLCDRAGLLAGLKGHGSLGRYGKLLKEAREAGNEVITEVESEQVKVWAIERNLAAHKPTEFKKSPDAVRLMIEGIRQFVARTE